GAAAHVPTAGFTAGTPEESASPAAAEAVPGRKPTKPTTVMLIAATIVNHCLRCTPVARLLGVLRSLRTEGIRTVEIRVPPLPLPTTDREGLRTKLDGSSA